MVTKLTIFGKCLTHHQKGSKVIRNPLQTSNSSNCLIEVVHVLGIHLQEQSLYMEKQREKGAFNNRKKRSLTLTILLKISPRHESKDHASILCSISPSSLPLYPKMTSISEKMDRRSSVVMICLLAGSRSGSRNS